MEPRRSRGLRNVRSSPLIARAYPRIASAHVASVLGLKLLVAGLAALVGIRVASSGSRRVVSQSVERRRLEYAAYVGVLRESGLALDVVR
jgi:molybdate-binding protein